MKMKRVLLCLALLSGCATQGINRVDQNEILKEFYASVHSTKQVKLSSEVKTGIIGGTVIGIIDELDGDHEDMIAGGLAGALVGGLFTALFEGGNKAFEYILYSQNEGGFTIIQKEKISILTGCVKVRLGSKVSISSVSKDNCKV